MKINKLFFAIAIISIIAVSCKETKKEDPTEVTEEVVVTPTNEVTEEVVVTPTNEVTEEVVVTPLNEVEEMAVEEGVILEKLADTPVVYPGCEGGTNDEIRACSIKEFRKFLRSNFDEDLSSNLDMDAGDHKIRALLKIDKTGKVTVRKITAEKKELENEMIRIIGKLPNMTAATKGGSPVDVSFVVPMNFKVEDY